MTPTADLVATTTMILSIPRVETAQAVVIWPGLERDRQIQHGIDVWKKNGAIKSLLIAGYHEPDVAQRELNLRALRETHGLPDGKYLRSQIHARHAGQQAEWVADTVKEMGLESIALFVPSFHIVRAFLTSLASFNRRGMKVSMIPMPTPMPPADGVQLEPHQPQWDLVTGEVKRIPGYRKTGDNATFLQLREYIDWMYEEGILRTT